MPVQSKTLLRQPIATLTNVLQLFVMDTVCTVLPEKSYSHRHPLLSHVVRTAPSGQHASDALEVTSTS